MVDEGIGQDVIVGGQLRQRQLLPFCSWRGRLGHPPLRKSVKFGFQVPSSPRFRPYQGENGQNAAGSEIQTQVPAEEPMLAVERSGLRQGRKKIE